MEWQKGYETDRKEHANEGWQTSDRGYILVGQNWEGNKWQYNILQQQSLHDLSENLIGVC